MTRYTHEPTFYRYRAPKALALLSRRWQPFASFVPPGSALDAKQLTGTLVALRNRGLAESRRWHDETGRCVTEWRST